MPVTSDDVKLEILNLSLAHLAEPPATSLTANVKGPLLFARFFPRVLKVVLSGFPWKFATKTAALVLVAPAPTTPNKFSLAYTRPSDCLRLRAIVAEDFTFAPEDEIPFDREGNVIWTDQEDAYALYTYDVTDCTLFDELFIDTIAKYMAVHLAMPITGKPEIQQSMLRLLQLTSPHAEATTAAERSKVSELDGTIKGSRA